MHVPRSHAPRLVLACVALPALLIAGCKNDYTFEPSVVEEAPVSDIGQWLQMDTAPDGKPVIAYYDVTDGGVGFAVGNVYLNGEIEWAHEEVDGYPDSQGLDSGDRGKYLSMTVAPDGHVWMSYHDEMNGGLRVAHRVGPFWGTAAVDGGTGASPDAGRWTSIATDASNLPVVAHHDEGSGVLRVSRMAADNTWSSETAWEGTDFVEGETTREADVGEYARLLIHDNTEYIAFYDTAWRRLELLEGTGGTYTHSTIYDRTGAGAWPSLWSDGDTLVVAFHDVENGDLLVGIREGGGDFSVQTVDSGEFVGADTEVFVRDGQLHVLYYDGFNNDLLHATQAADGTWTREVLGEEGKAVGFHNEVTKLGDGTWLYGTYNYTDRSLVISTLP
jgi:hypothetical protein